ncbi:MULTISPECIES: hypothetical protein [Parabacteroides]|nr:MULTISPECIES: hypothetical protein [Parabacteroides]
MILINNKLRLPANLITRYRNERIIICDCMAFQKRSCGISVIKIALC